FAISAATRPNSRSCSSSLIACFLKFRVDYVRGCFDLFQLGILGRNHRLHPRKTVVTETGQECLLWCAEPLQSAIVLQIELIARQMMFDLDLGFVQYRIGAVPNHAGGG